MSAARARAESVARSTARTVGRLTSGSRMTPSFLIAGAQRCGTTSLYKTLAQHPAVLPAVLHKGVHYFDVGYDRGPRWYAGHFPLRRTAARASEASGQPAVTGESSPYYLFHPLAAQRIAHDLPDVKVLVLLRDPVERAYSAYTHERARGYETETFERALELEPERLAGQAERLAADPHASSFDHQHHGYLTRGRYLEQLERFEREIGPERLHVLDSEEFFSDPGPVFEGVLHFLGLEPTPGVRFEQHNARPRSALEPQLRDRLRAEMAPYDDALETWWGRLPWRA